MPAGEGVSRTRIHDPLRPEGRRGRGPSHQRWEGEVGVFASALESPTSPQPSPPPGAERESDGRGCGMFDWLPIAVPPAALFFAQLLVWLIHCAFSALLSNS